ncbi:monocarboxylate transporter 9-like isoform X2 [Lytechinus pictus]|uniref:monocarboxylate transporter 9-like isoform X2 n=1 Tax=Lytechinus pictus TaxID=7653 RepID=UPI0030BA10E6
MQKKCMIDVPHGTGYSLVAFPAHAFPVQYFPDKFELASSIIATAGGLGMMVLPVIAEQFNRIYGWRQAMLLLGAVSLHNIPIGALVKTKESTSGARTPSPNDDDVVHHGNEYCSTSVSEPLLKSTSVDCQAETSCGESSSGCRRDDYDGDNHLNALSNTKPNTQSKDTSNHLLKYNNSKTSNVISNSKTIVTEKETGSVNNSLQESLWQSLKILTGFDLVEKKPDVLSSIFAILTLGMSYSGWIIFVVPNGIAKGYPLETSILLAAVGGGSNIFGRFIIGFVSKWQLFSNQTLFVMLCVVCSVAYAMNILSTHFWTLCVLAVINGSTLGAMTTMLSFLARDVAPDGDVEGVISLFLVALGGGLPLGGYAVGWLFDRSKSYDVPFMFLGSVGLVSAFFIIIPSIPNTCCCVYQSICNAVFTK